MTKRSMFAIILCGGILFAGCKKTQAPTSSPLPTQKPRKIDVNVNKEPVENRPFVRLAPREDGKAVTMTIVEMKKQATDAEYEIEYSSGSLLQGAFGQIDSLTSTPIKKEILLGSCSSGGKCTYNTDVTGGTLSLRFGSPDFTLKSEWSYTEKALKEKSFSSRDAKFTLDVSKAKNSANFVIIHQGPGYPGSLEGKVVAGPYEVAPADSIKGTVTVSIRLPLDATDGRLMVWDGKSWGEWKSTTKDKVVTGAGPMGEVYVVVAK